MDLNLELCSVRLPVELYEEILRLAAWDVHEIDKPWLCALATVSRRVLAFVRPILYHTVCVTTTTTPRLKLSGLRSVVACAPHGYFALTRCLWVDIAPDDWQRHRLGAIFNRVEHISAGLLFLLHYHTDADSERTPPRVTLRVKLHTDDWRRFSSSSSSVLHPALRSLTHLRVAVDPFFGVPSNSDMHSLGTLSPALALQYVVLESTMLGWNAPRLCAVILPFFLSGVNVRRVLVCAAVHSVSRELEAYAAERREGRLWTLDAPPTNGSVVGQYQPGVTFDQARWVDVRQVYTWPDSDA